MATFPSIAPAYTVSKSNRPKIRVTQFGDGYQQRTIFGLASHNNPREFYLTFKVKDAQAATIETFLDARAADAASFDFTPPGTSTPAKFICRSWSRAFIGTNWNEISATFEEVFEP